MREEMPPAFDTPEYEKWYNGELSCENVLYDPRCNVNMGQRNAGLVLNELGFWDESNEDRYCGAIALDVFTQLSLRDWRL